MSLSTVLGIAAMVALVAFVVFAFRQGMKVRNDPVGTPPEQWPH